MGGHERCSWGDLPLEGWADPIWTRECTYDRIPLGYWLDFLSRPDELAAYGNPANGTVVRLNTLTYSAAHVPVQGATTSHPYIRFMSAIIPLWEREMQGRQEWSEPYVLTAGGWANLDAYESWLAAWNAHQTSELRRLERYQEERETYESRDCLRS